MRIDYTEHALAHLDSSPEKVRKAFYKQVHFLTQNIRHPSLHAKKYDEASNLWQARITQSWRFYFLIKADEYIIIAIRNHPK
jgi:mRNA-degrading endonuclease RelE of RelBE toxin-antitoxin system